MKFLQPNDGEVKFLQPPCLHWSFEVGPTKEAVVIWTKFDPLRFRPGQARPDDEPPVETLRAVIRKAMSGLYRRDPERLLARVR